METHTNSYGIIILMIELLYNITYTSNVLEHIPKTEDK